jgi:tryptophanyl-tRNA synthetase
MYTDPKRLRATDPGNINPEENPLWAMHVAFNGDQAWVKEQQALYADGKVGDVAIKKRLIEVLNAFLEPIRARRAQLSKDDGFVIEALRVGTARANVVAEETLMLAKRAMKQDYFPRTLSV